jgi:two-component system, NtrC family, nitrogen regulation sensor histidine kinase GlnL
MLFINDVDVTSGERPPVQCNIQIAPMHRECRAIVLLLMDRAARADRLTAPIPVKTAAKSAIGMAEMLAHEIKNPLAGITGAAQLLSMNLGAEDRELTDLIVEETRRIVKLLEQVEQFGNLRPPDRARSTSTTRSTGRASRRWWALPPHDDSSRITTPRCRPPGRWRPADAGVPEPDQERGRGGRAKGGGTIRLRTFYDLSLRLRRKDGHAASAAPADRDHRRRPGHPARDRGGDLRALRLGPRERHRASASRSSRRSSPTMTAGSRSTPCPGAPCSASRCRWRPRIPEGKHPE